MDDFFDKASWLWAVTALLASGAALALAVLFRMRRHRRRQALERAARQQADSAARSAAERAWAEQAAAAAAQARRTAQAEERQEHARRQRTLQEARTAEAAQAAAAAAAAAHEREQARAAALVRAQAAAVAAKAAADAAAALPPPAPARPPTPPPHLPPPAPAQTLVLVADDSKVVRVKTSRLLVRHGFRVALAEDGLQAAQLIDVEMPRVLITDVEMPGMDGLALTRHVRSHPRAGHIPIIMITSADARLREAAIEAGVTLVLGKPYADEALLACVETARAEAAVHPS